MTYGIADINKWRVADLFAGIGGFRLGFQKAGYQVVYANDNNPWCKLTYEANFGLGSMDLRPIEDVPSEEIPDFEILLAGFPCQPFSIAGKRKGFLDKRGNAFFELVRIIKDKKPKVIVLENVKHIIGHNGGNTMETIRHILENELGYSMNYEVLNSKDFGVPQSRKRLYMVGFWKDTSFEFPEGHGKTVKVGDVLEKKDVDESYFLSQKYLEGLEKHKARHKAKGHGFGYEILDTDGIAHLLVVGNMGRERNLIQDKPRPNFYKPGMDKAKAKNEKGVRKLTDRECARLQGFGEKFKIPVPVSKAYAQFGNAVSVPVTFAVAKQINKTLKELAIKERIKVEKLSSVKTELGVTI